MASRVTFIGAGNMASAIIGGMIDNGHPATAITATSPSDAFLAPLHERYGIRTNTDNASAVQGADVVVLAVKPQVMREVCEGLSDTLQRLRPLIVSVAAGIDAETLDQWLGGGLPLIRCMPNTPSLVGAGASGLFANAEVNAEQRAQATQLLEAVGLVEWVEEEALLDAVTAVSGSGPAYFFLMFEAMEEAGVKLGLPAETARRLAMQTALGAARMAQQSDQPPAQLKRNVMSPGGTTERAVEHLEQAGLRDIMRDAMDACAARAREMADEFGTR
ncbi:pyrroline-5-carboxylate reductase [Halomonas campisalis]|uniref:Pyrroline-5-carboxylate reductase n=1 Tax=Billgrantia campisalis TaxID=74661 RepID=A0ABS9PCS0_9GAMM|nr:pyrroline-5-carboxylate reductase [Halomonas campisalis]MCG6659563.1 pyrroline-5-carboxylate reductase [Halomonas campisalis]MDR5864398.1 pyrroline-5-carboxylate reductase [Halomonas campisalis]